MGTNDVGSEASSLSSPSSGNDETIHSEWDDILFCGYPRNLSAKVVAIGNDRPFFHHVPLEGRNAFEKEDKKQIGESNSSGSMKGIST